MNTERPDNDDADADAGRSVEERGAGGSAEEPGAAGRKGASGGSGALSAGTSGDERGPGAGEASGTGASAASETAEVSDAGKADGEAASPAVSNGSGTSDTDARAGAEEAADAERGATAAPEATTNPSSAAAPQAAADEDPATTGVDATRGPGDAPEAGAHPGPDAEEGPGTADERPAAATEAAAHEQPAAASEAGAHPAPAPATAGPDAEEGPDTADERPAAATEAAAHEQPAAASEAGAHPAPATAGPDAEEGPDTADERPAAATEAAAQGSSTALGPSAPQAPAAPPATEIPRGEHGQEQGGRRTRRRSPAVVVSVAAAVLVVGGGGAYFATTAAEGSAGSDGRATSGASGTPGGGTPPPLALDGYSQGGGTNGIAPGEPNPYGVTYRAAGVLPDGPESAPVYRTGGQVTKDEAARLAEALGIDGTPVASSDAWTVGAGDGTGPSLRVAVRAPGNWTFHRYSPGTDNCQSQTVCAKTPAAPGGDPVSEAVARKAAAPVLKAVGQDDTKVDASRTLGAQRIVNADPVIGDLPTYGWTTDVIVDAQGQVVSGNGQSKVPVKGDTYPVLGAEETLALLNAAPGTGHRMGIGGCATPVPLKDRLEAPCGSQGSKGSATAVPAKETLTVEKAVFGLASHTVAGRPALVPSWLFDVRAAGAEDDYTVTYPAVDPRYLASPSTRPTEPGDRPTAAPAPRDVHVDGYTAAGRELTVSFTGGMCADYKATASESGDKVTVKVTETRWPDKVCILIAKVYEKTVQLNEPLGDRTVVGSDGKQVPLEKAARLPRTPETSGAR
ncbi:hypothetical protein [Streptomyces cellulosae]|uniref:Large membrane protein n=1 Tax=Streptomyces cellulosae TaxID=1968 RepID=A0ABW7Y208_STRCE